MRAPKRANRPSSLETGSVAAAAAVGAPGSAAACARAATGRIGLIRFENAGRRPISNAKRR